MTYTEAYLGDYPTVCQQCYAMVMHCDQDLHDSAIHSDSVTIKTVRGETVAVIPPGGKWTAPIIVVDPDKCYHPETKQ